MPFQTFHIDYDAARGGQFGEDEQLIGKLDGYGAGLERSGELSGGPLLIRPRDGEDVVVGWIRSKLVREGAYEAWGVTGPKGEDVATWVSYWTLLGQYDHDHVERLASGMTKREFGNYFPDVPPNLANELTRVALAHERGDESFVTSVNESPDIELLPWLWLLGPIDCDKATLGPPRRSPHSSLTYQGQVGPPPISPEPDKSIVEIVELLKKGDIEPAMTKARSLRGGRISRGSARQPAPTPMAAVPRAKTEPANPPILTWAAPALPIGKPSEPTSGRFDAKASVLGRFWPFHGRPNAGRSPMPSLRSELRSIRRRLDVLALLLLVLVFVHVLPRIRQASTKPPALTPAATPTAAPRAQDQPAAAPKGTENASVSPLPDSTNCDAGFVSLPDQKRLVQGLTQKLAADKDPVNSELSVFLARASAATTVWTPPERTRIVGAAVQLYMNRQCLPLPARIDGYLGPGSKKALDDCKQSRSVPVATDDGALRWLCGECAHFPAGR